MSKRKRHQAAMSAGVIAALLVTAACLALVGYLLDVEWHAVNGALVIAGLAVFVLLVTPTVAFFAGAVIYSAACAVFRPNTDYLMGDS